MKHRVAAERLTEARARWEHHRAWHADGAPRWPWWSRARLRSPAQLAVLGVTLLSTVAVALGAG